MLSSWVKEKGTSQVMYIAKLKDGKKELRKLSQWLWKGFFKRYDGGGENGITSKRIFEVEGFSPFKILTSPFIWRDNWSFPFSLFFHFHAPSPEDSGVLMIYDEKITSSKTSFQMASIYWRWTHTLEWSYARQHG
jgi:hypothetical protein